MVIYRIDPAKLAVFWLLWGLKLQVGTAFMSLGMYDIIKS